MNYIPQRELRRVIYKVAVFWFLGYNAYRSVRKYFSWAPEDMVQTEDGVYIAGFTNGEGPPPTHNRHKRINIPPWRRRPEYNLPTNPDYIHGFRLPNDP